MHDTVHADGPGRSTTAVVHAALLPFKIFFALILFVISIMLAIWRKTLESHYSHYMDGIERGVHRRHLVEDIDAIALVLDHALYAADLAFDARQPL